MKRFVQYLPLLLLGFAGCSEQEAPDLSPNAYYPLQVGRYLIYDIEEVRYSAFSPPQNFAYQLKAEIVDSFANLEGGTTWVIHRSTRPDDASSWVFDQTWSARFKGQYVVEAEGNIPYAKLVFPLQKNSRWNGNLYNESGEDEYTLESIGTTYSVTPSLKFQSCIVVNQSNENSLVFRDERVEVYSSGTGLVYKESKVYQYNTVGGLPGTQIAGGYYWRQVLREKGQN